MVDYQAMFLLVARHLFYANWVPKTEEPLSRFGLPGWMEGKKVYI